jgi:hypothetical protein
LANGGEGPVGKAAYLQLLRVEEIPQYNEDYEVSEYASGLVVFGSNLGGTFYAFDLRERTKPVVSLPIIPLDIDEADRLGETFSEFIEYMYNLEYPE